jgi:hypothetical protein
MKKINHRFIVTYSNGSVKKTEEVSIWVLTGKLLMNDDIEVTNILHITETISFRKVKTTEEHLNPYSDRWKLHALFEEITKNS